MGITTFMVLKSRQWHQWDQTLRGWVPFPLFMLISKHFSRTKQVLGRWRIPLLKKRGVHPGHRKQVTLHLHLRGKNIRTYSFIFKYSHGFLHFCVFLFLEKTHPKKIPNSHSKNRRRPPHGSDADAPVAPPWARARPAPASGLLEPPRASGISKEYRS